MINKESISKLPSSIGVYIFKKGKKILYIGKSVNIRSRVYSHWENSRLDPKENLLIQEADKIKYFLVNSEFQALMLEAQLIKKYRPKYNIRWRDDKNFLWIKITTMEKFPKVFLVRKENDQQSVYIGPFTAKNEAEMILREARKIVPFCSDKKINRRPCFYSKIGLCDPCPNTIINITDKKMRKNLTKKYQKNIHFLIDILKGNLDKLQEKIKRRVKKLVNEENFEEAIFWREKLNIINQLSMKKINLDSHQETNDRQELKQLENFLQNYFNVKKLRRIEGFDVSNLFFKEKTASMVVFIDGYPDLSQYRKFKLKTSQNSDAAMLKETLIRRFKNSWPLPDLILIDGGVNQLKIGHTVVKQMKLNIPLISIAKNPDRVFILNNNKILKIPVKKISGGLIFNYIRDESHRFAKKYHLLLRRKKLTGKLPLN